MLNRGRGSEGGNITHPGRSTVGSKNVVKAMIASLVVLVWTVRGAVACSPNSTLFLNFPPPLRRSAAFFITFVQGTGYNRYFGVPSFAPCLTMLRA